MDNRAHWEKIYTEKAADAVSWYRPHLGTSLCLIEELAGSRSAAIIDIGGGQSTLVDDLLSRGYRDVTVLDLSQTAIEATKRRLGEASGNVRWLVGDITHVDLEWSSYDIWHDRAVFHFLTNAVDRMAYVRQISQSMKPGGCVIIGTFAVDGPAECSGLDVVRYDAPSLQRELGDDFSLHSTHREIHHTPSGTIQPFLYCTLKFR